MQSFAEYRPLAHGERDLVSVRAAVDADIGSIEGIQQRAGRTARLDAYSRAIESPNQCLLVARVTAADGASVVVGWGQTHLHTVVTDPAPPGHYLGGVTVDPLWRRRGVAFALTRARIDWISKRASEVHYVVNPRNLASIELHRPWSFEAIAHAPQLAGATFDGGDGLLMRAVLPPSALSQGPF